VLVPLKPEHSQGDFDLTTDALVQNSPRHYLFGNIAYFNLNAFKDLAIDRFSISQLLRSWASQQQLSAQLYSGQWFDTGTPARLALALNH
jgi:MurNAc alpha-1-phosphate uridylyltransferase